MFEICAVLMFKSKVLTTTLTSEPKKIYAFHFSFFLFHGISFVSAKKNTLTFKLVKFILDGINPRINLNYKYIHY